MCRAALALGTLSQDGFAAATGRRASAGENMSKAYHQAINMRYTT